MRRTGRIELGLCVAYSGPLGTYSTQMIPFWMTHFMLLLRLSEAIQDRFLLF